MAIIKCPECEKDISNQAINCPNCGFPVQQKIKEEQELKAKKLEQIKKEEQEKIRREKEVELKQKRKEALKKIKPIHIIGIIIAIILIVIIALFITKSLTYNNAVKAFESGNYKDAYEYFKNSSYKDSVNYREKTILEYTKLLIEEKDFETADQMLSLVADEVTYNELKEEMIYVRAIDAYEAGAFELSYNLFSNLKDYKGANDYKSNAKLMKNIQGEWNLSGFKFVFMGNNKEMNYAALKIDGWYATLLYCTDGKSTYKEAGSCKLTIMNTSEATLKIGTTEYIITTKNFINGELYALMINDDVLESFDGDYIWKHGEFRDRLIFLKVENGVPKQPQIGMTAKELENSAWGKPEDINKSTYSWGIKEQWCYSDNRYIYLEDGIVTSISE